MAHGGCTNSKKLLFTRLFGFAVGAWASTGDNWASPLWPNRAQYADPITPLCLLIISSSSNESLTSANNTGGILYGLLLEVIAN